MRSHTLASAAALALLAVASAGTSTMAAAPPRRRTEPAPMPEYRPEGKRRAQWKSERGIRK